MARNESWIGVQIDVRRSLFFSDIDRFGRELGDRQSVAIAAHGGIWGLPDGRRGVPRPLGDIMSTKTPMELVMTSIDSMATRSFSLTEPVQMRGPACGGELPLAGDPALPSGHR